MLNDTFTAAILALCTNQRSHVVGMAQIKVAIKTQENAINPRLKTHGANINNKQHFVAEKRDFTLWPLLRGHNNKFGIYFQMCNRNNHYFTRRVTQNFHVRNKVRRNFERDRKARENGRPTKVSVPKHTVQRHRSSIQMEIAARLKFQSQIASQTQRQTCVCLCFTCARACAKPGSCMCLCLRRLSLNTLVRSALLFSS